MMSASRIASVSSLNILPVLASESPHNTRARFLDLRPYFTYPIRQKNISRMAITANTTNIDVKEHRRSMLDGSEVSSHLGSDRGNDIEKQQPVENQEPAQQDGRALQRTPSAVEYPPIAKAAVIMISLYLTVFLVALDRTIIGTAIPAITVGCELLTIHTFLTFQESLSIF